jgi:pyridoxal phosphate enzyme (YggS family)
VTLDESDPAESLAEALRAVRERIAGAARRAGRVPEAVTLVAVSKTVAVQRVAEAAAAGVRDFGENHAAELQRKAALVPGARWHFLGKLQRGTVRHVDAAAVVHSGEPGGAVEALARRSAARDRVVDVLAQVDFTGRRQGTDPADLSAFVEHLHALGGIRPVGLMTIPPLAADPREARPYFVRLRDLRDGLTGDWPGLVELSMGMSADYEVAVEEGATMVRVGTALFGHRPVPPKR